MKSIFFASFFLLLIAFSCKVQKTDAALNQDDFLMTEELNVKNGEIPVKYLSATFYAGSTDYFFKTDAGKILKINVLNAPEEQDVKIPNNLLDPNKNLEGPPCANPKLVGKKFVVKTDENAAPVEIVRQ